MRLISIETVVTRSWNNEWLGTACKPAHHILKATYFALMVTDHHGLAKVPALDGMCVASCRFEGFTLGQILDHVFHMVVAAWVSGEEPRSSDEHGPVHALHKALQLNKEIHIFISSGTSLILEGPAGYTYQMQRGLDLMACKSFGTGKSNLFSRVVYIQPTINNTVKPNNDMSLRHLMAHITVEAANCGRLLSINSSSSDYTLRTFISSTESVKVEESQTDVEPGVYAELRHAYSYQVVSKLHNFITSTQQGEPRRTVLNRRPTYSSEGRSVNGKLTLEFLGEYSTAILVDLKHSISVAKFEDLSKEAKKNYKIHRPKPNITRMTRLRAELPNCLFSAEEWTKAANLLAAITEPTCFNRQQHIQPVVFKDVTAFGNHVAHCFGGGAGPSGSQDRPKGN